MPLYLTVVHFGYRGIVLNKVHIVHCTNGNIKAKETLGYRNFIVQETLVSIQCSLFFHHQSIIVGAKVFNMLGVLLVLLGLSPHVLGKHIAR